MEKKDLQLQYILLWMQVITEQEINIPFPFQHNVKCVVSPPTVPPYHLRLGRHHHRPGVGVTAEHPNPLLV